MELVVLETVQQIYEHCKLYIQFIFAEEFQGKQSPITYFFILAENSSTSVQSEHKNLKKTKEQ